MDVRLMGNCSRCYYCSTQTIYLSDFLDENPHHITYFSCHRYPQVQDVNGNHFCGEFISKSEVAEMQESGLL